MATQNTVNFNVNVSDNGTAKKVVKNFNEITQAAQGAQVAASKVAPPQGGTSGSRQAAYKAAPTGSQARMSENDYNRARGSAGVTGASARDFAKQAQGLGGLVRLYATLAANVFAASAAFTALKNAADTTNLIKGLDILGAQSGQALGSLSKRLVEVTDGAVSMREAMTATAQASSAGMSGKNIERLALVAKNASLALGVAMPDALNRLSRGIVKLEPELLDELGLFTKIGPATEKYALEIGKTASSLTDFERRQAFANAVLEEGEKKFGALAQAASNPYDKLLASLKNVLQSGLELVNKVLTPIVTLLAESPGALGAVLAGIGVVLLKQALPAIGELRAGLRNSAEQALKTAEAFKESFGDEFQANLEKRFRIPDLKADIRKTEQDLSKLKFPGKLPDSLKDLQEGEFNQKKINNLLETRNNTIDTGMRGSRKASEAQIAQAKQEIAYIEKQILLYKQKQALEAASEGSVEAVSGKVSRFDAEVIAQKKYLDLKSKVDKVNAISNAAQVAQVSGVRVAYQLLNREIAEKGITGFSKYSTVAQGTLAAVGTRIMGVVSSLGAIGQAIGLAIAGFMLLDSWLSKNAKEMERFNTALKTSEDSVNNVTRTLVAATDSQGFATNTIANTIALSNAFNELTSSAKEALKTEKAAAASANIWDNFWNGVFSIVGKDRETKLADSIAKQISSSIRLLSREGLDEEYAAEISKILNVDNLQDISSVSKAWKKLSEDQKNSVLDIQDNSNRALGNSSGMLQNFKEKTDSALTAYKTFSNSFVDSSPVFKLGEAYIQVGQGLEQIIAAGPNRIAQAFDEIAKNTQKATLFGLEFIKAFAPIADQFVKQKAAIDAANASLKEQILASKTLNNTGNLSTLTKAPGAQEFQRPLVAAAATNEQKALVQENIRLAKLARDRLDDSAVRQGTKILADAAKTAISTGFALVNKSIANAKALADIGISKVLSSTLTGPQKLAADNDIRQRELKLKLAEVVASEELLKLQGSLIDETRLANALQAEANALQKQSVAEQKSKAAPGDKSLALELEKATKATFTANKEVQLSGARVGRTEGIDADILAAANRDRATADSLRTKGTQAQREAITGEMRASTLSMSIQMPGANLQQQEQLAKITDRKLAAERAGLEVANSMSGLASEQLLLSKQREQSLAIEKAQKSEIAAIDVQIEAINIAMRSATGEDLERQKDQLAVQEKLKTETQAAQKVENDTTGLKNRQELLNFEITKIGQRAELTTAQRDLENTVNQNKLDYQSQELQLLASTYDMSQKALITRQADLDAQKSQLQQSTAIATAEAEMQRKRDEAAKRRESLGGDAAIGDNAKLVADIDAETNRQQTLLDITKQKLTEEGTQRLALIDRAKTLNLEQERYNFLMETTNGLAESLTVVFGELGSSLGSVVSAMTNMAIQSERNNVLLAQNAAEQKKLNDLGDLQGLDPAQQKKFNDLKQEEISLNQKSAKDELKNSSAVAGSAKKLFKEKTTAYKAFAAIEKGTQIASLALELKTIGGKIAAWLGMIPVKAATEATLTGIETTAAVAKAPLTFGQIVGNYMSKLPPPFGAIAGFAAGAVFLKLLGVGGGGSAPPVGFSAEEQQKVQGTGQMYAADGKIVTRAGGVLGDSKALADSISTSIEMLSKDFFGIFDSDNSNVIKALKGIEKNTGDLSKALIGGTSGLFGGNNPFGVTEGSASSVLGFSKSSTSIADEGIKVTGTLGDITNGLGEFNQYLNTVRKSSSFWGVFSSTSYNTAIQSLAETAPKAVEAIRKIFIGVETALIASSEYFYGAGSASDTWAKDIIRNVQIELKTSSKGLSATEFAEAVNAEISVQLNAAAQKAFPGLVAFQQLGEEMYETATRLMKDSQVIRDGFAMIGLSSKQLTGTVTETVSSFFGLFNKTVTRDISSASGNLTDTTQLEQDLIEAAGGSEAFASGIKTISSEFLNATERYNLSFGKLSASFTKAGIQLPKTKKEYMDLISTTTDVTKLGTLISYVDDYITLVDMQSEAQSKQNDELKDSISKFREFAKSIKDFRDGLLLGSSSVLTPQEKYLKAKSDFESNLTKALSGDQEAISKYQTYAQALLENSKVVNASSAAYTTDFQRILETSDTVSASASAKADVAQLQLDAATSSVALLTSIDTNIALIAGVPQAARGGRASGLTLVGELGPELVDFSMPGQVYTAEQTAGMFAAPSNSNPTQVFGTMVAEIRSLKQEVSQLRREQQKQTGDIIVSNYDANQRNASEVAEAVEDSVNSMGWQDRSKSVIK